MPRPIFGAECGEAVLAVVGGRSVVAVDSPTQGMRVAIFRAGNHLLYSACVPDLSFCMEMCGACMQMDHGSDVSVCTAHS